MIVYIVIDSPSYEQSTILAVCSSKDIAEEYVKHADHYIEEWTIK